MKFKFRLPLFVIVALVALPLVIAAQDNRQQSLANVKAFPVQAPTLGVPDDADLIVPFPSGGTLTEDEAVPQPPIDIQPAQAATEELYDYPVKTEEPFPPAQAATEELIEYPSNPCKQPHSTDPLTALAQIDCPPTLVPTRTPVPITVTPGAGIINGLWVLEPGSSGYSSTGNCQVDNGDNGGPDRETNDDDELPTVPVCMTSDRQWLTVNGGGAYPMVLPNIYSQQEMQRELIFTNGKTTGSVDVNVTHQYQVISPSEIVYSYITQEKGGCTSQNTFHYKLKEANNLVCTGMVIIPIVTLTPISTLIPTPKPGETQQPPITPEPPIKTGRYIITLPPTDDQCKADTLPQSDKMDVSYDNNQNIFINFGGGSYTLYWDGGTYYSYSENNTFDLSLVTYEGGASFSWSKEGCFISSDLIMEGAPTAAPAPVEPTSEADTGEVVAIGSSFTTTFDAQEMYCAAENKSMLPDLNTAILIAKDDKSFIFSVGGQNYTLANQDGYYVFTQINDDGSMLAIAMNGFYDGNGSGSFSVYGTDGKMCTAMLTFTPAG